MSPPPAPFPLATVAGTASSQPQALWLRVAQAEAAAIGSTPCPPDGRPPSSPFVDARLLVHWTAAAQLPVPSGQVFWLPTPASAGTAERALEQACRQQLMQDAMDGCTCLRVLYGPPGQQLRALQECLQALQIQDAEAAAPGSGSAAGSALPHGHAPHLRCRECVDPASEQRLFSRLLGGRKEPADDPGQR